jgi:hypothetical protein
MKTIISVITLAALSAAPVDALDCASDCDGNGQVTVDEIVVAANVALGETAVDDCTAADTNGDGQVTVDELITAVDAALNGCAGQNTAFVVATDFETGSFGTVSFDDPPVITPVSPQRILNSDAVARAFNGLVYVVNRFFGDNIQIIDPAQDFATTRQCLTGAGSNPQDIAFVDAEKGYVSLGGGTEVLVVDPSPSSDCSDFIRDRIDLAELADDDGKPELYLMAIVGDRLYVELQKLDQNNFFVPAENGSLAVIDTTTDAFVEEIVLTGQNPFGQTKGIPTRNGALLVNQIGLFGVTDGGIERVDPVSGQPQGYIIAESDLGADIVDFVMLSDTVGYAVLSLPDFTNSVVLFDVDLREATATLISGESISDIELNDRARLFVAQRTLQNPGVRIFDTADNSEVTGAPLNLELPPFDIVFVP